MKYFSIFTVMMGALALALPHANAQAQAKVDIKNIEVSTMPTPQFAYDGESKKLPSAQDWVEVEVEFEVELADRTKEFVDDLEFTYYVVVDDGKNSMLVQRVTHINVPVKEEIFSNVFISPTAIKKLTGGAASSSSVVEGVGVEVRYQGALVGTDTTKKPAGWWQRMTQVSGQLLNKSQTPFAILWWDRYAQEKKER